MAATERAQLSLALAKRVTDRLAARADGGRPDAHEEQDLNAAIAELTAADEEFRRQPPGDDDAIGKETWLRVRFGLGLTHGSRYLAHGTDDLDRDLAISELTEVAATATEAGFTEIADTAHLMAATVILMSAAPTEVRQWQPRRDWARHLRSAPLPAGPSAEQRAAIEEHLGALSPETLANPAATEMLSALRAGAALGEAPAARRAEDHQRVLSWLDENMDRFAEQGMSAEISLIREGFQAVEATLAGDTRSLLTAVSKAGQLAGGLADQTRFQELYRALLGTVGPDLDPPGGDPCYPELAAGMRELLAELSPEHPESRAVLIRLAFALLLSMNADRNSADFAEVLDVLSRARDLDDGNPILSATSGMMLGLSQGMLGMLSNDVDLIDSGIESMRAAARSAPDGHLIGEVIPAGLSVLLNERGTVTGDLSYADAAAAYAKVARDPSIDGEPTAALSGVASISGLISSMVSLGRGTGPDLAGMTQVRQHLESALANNNPRVASMLESMRPAFDLVTLGLRFADNDFDISTVDRTAVDTAIGALTDAASNGAENQLTEVVDVLTAGMALAMPGFFLNDTDALDRAVTLFATAPIDESTPLSERVGQLTGLAMVLRMRHLRRREPADLSNAIELYERARELIDDAKSAELLNMLAECYHDRNDPHRGDRRRAVATGVDGLRERARGVLLQSSPDHGLEAARAAEGEATEVLRWCLDADDNASAVAALELGRGMVLHAATVDAGVPDLLASAGHDDLALRWRRQVAARPGGTSTTGVVLEVPDDLRRGVLAAVRGTETYERLLAPPTIADITEALALRDTDALVYLVPGVHQQAGLALLVYADGRAEAIPLAGLRADAPVLTEFGRARDAWQNTPQESKHADEVREPWTRALARICALAWQCALRQVLTAVAGNRGRPAARLVLVPAGELSGVPWHAASRPISGGRVRFACQDTLISYAASARQFVDGAHRPVRPWGRAPAVVRSAGSTLYWARIEVNELRRRWYGVAARPDHRPPGERELLDLLPGGASPATLLHLSAHAFHRDPPTESYLALSRNTRLPVGRMLAQAKKRPAGAAGGLVVLAACTSDLSGSVHDEALTLASAFLSAGSAGVLGARWTVDDLPTALFMVMFHHYLNSGYEDPVAALRAVQRWMLDERRQLPNGTDPALVAELPTAQLAEPTNWAAFTYQGH